MARLDFLRNADNTLMMQNGDFVIDNGELQQAKRIIKTYKGAYFKNLLLGVQIDKYIGSDVDKTLLYNEIKTQLALDGLFVDYIRMDTIDSEITFDIKLK